MKYPEALIDGILLDGLFIVAAFTYLYSVIVVHDAALAGVTGGTVFLTAVSNLMSRLSQFNGR